MLIVPSLGVSANPRSFILAFYETSVLHSGQLCEKRKALHAVCVLDVHHSRPARGLVPLPEGVNEP